MYRHRHYSLEYILNFFYVFYISKDNFFKKNLEITKIKWREVNFSPSKFFCCQVNWNPANSSYRIGLSFGCFGCLRCCSYRSIVVICNYYNSPITVVQYRVKVWFLLHASILFRPHIYLVEAPGTAPGSAKLILKNVYHYSH